MVETFAAPCDWPRKFYAHVFADGCLVSIKPLEVVRAFCHEHNISCPVLDAYGRDRASVHREIAEHCSGKISEYDIYELLQRIQFGGTYRGWVGQKGNLCGDELQAPRFCKDLFNELSQVYLQAESILSLIWNELAYDRMHMNRPSHPTKQMEEYSSDVTSLHGNVQAMKRKIRSRIVTLYIQDMERRIVDVAMEQGEPFAARYMCDPMYMYTGFLMYHPVMHETPVDGVDQLCSQLSEAVQASLNWKVRFQWEILQVDPELAVLPTELNDGDHGDDGRSRSRSRSRRRRRRNRSRGRMHLDRSSGETDPECPICLEFADMTHVLACSHRLHEACWGDWKIRCVARRVVPTCPLCRVEQSE